MIESMKRVIDAWDASVLPKNHDGRLWQVLEEMRQDIAEAEKAEPVAWLITDENINHLQVESIQKLIDRARHANMTDIKLRINGQDEWYQADWLKHMTRTSPPQRQQEPFAYTRGDDVILAKHWTADEPPEGWEPVYAGLQRQPLTEQFIMDSTRELSRDFRWPSTMIDVWRLCEAAHGIKGEA